MSMLNSKFRKGIALVAGLGVVMVAVAQPGPGFGPGMMCRGGPGMMMGGYGPMFASDEAEMVKFQQERLARVKEKLGITAEQQPAWNAFAAKMESQFKTMRTGAKDTTTTAATTAPERMKQHHQSMSEHQKTMESMTESFTALYEALMPKQREMLDRFFNFMPRHG
ncbi:MAG: Spy/CpxP family protein refolding chaperone [Rhodocyclaceae bacterium]|nr:Spy/CpxP family protein refolding chaperone [Rhodocyclaceae bacterium]